MKKLLKEYLRRGNKLVRELWKKEVEKPYREREVSFKHKPDSKFKERIIENTEKPIYEATNISNAYEGIYWKWQRVKEYFREIEDKYCDMWLSTSRCRNIS